MATTPLSQYSAAAGTRSQVNTGKGPVYDKSVTPGGVGGQNLYNSSGAYIGPKVIPPAGYVVDASGKVVPYAQPIPGTKRILSSTNMVTGEKTIGGLPGGATKSYMIGGSGGSSGGIGAGSIPGLSAADVSFLQSMYGGQNATGPVTYTQKKTLQNIQERLGLNEDIVALLGDLTGNDNLTQPKRRGFSISKNVSQRNPAVDKLNQFVQSRLAALSTPMPAWMQQNAQRDVAGGINPIAAAVNAGAGGLVDPISGKVGDGIRENASLTNYINRANATMTAGMGGVSYDTLINAYRRAIGLPTGGIGSGGRPV